MTCNGVYHAFRQMQLMSAFGRNNNNTISDVHGVTVNDTRSVASVIELQQPVVESLLSATNDIAQVTLYGMLVQTMYDSNPHENPKAKQLDHDNLVQILDKTIQRYRIGANSTFPNDFFSKNVKYVRWYIECGRDGARFEIAPNSVCMIETRAIHGCIVRIQGKYQCAGRMMEIQSMTFVRSDRIRADRLTNVLSSSSSSELSSPQLTFHVDVDHENQHYVSVNGRYIDDCSRVPYWPQSDLNPLRSQDGRVVVVYGLQILERMLAINPQLQTFERIVDLCLHEWRHLCPVMPSFDFVKREFSVQRCARIDISKEPDEMELDARVRVLLFVSNEQYQDSKPRPENLIRKDMSRQTLYGILYSSATITL